jgi:hypothetical protein
VRAAIVAERRNEQKEARIMADKINWYRGYEIAYYWRAHRNNKVSFLMWEKADGLPPIHDGSYENSFAAADQKARELIDQTLAKLTSN